MKFSILALGLFFFQSILSVKAVVYEPNFTIRYQAHEDYQVISLSGSFKKGEELEKIERVFYRLNPSIKKLVIDLNFSGGYDELVKHFRNMVQGYCRINGCKLITLVNEEMRCSSYCMLIFMAGEERRAYGNSVFGFHTAYREDREGNILEMSTEQMIKEYREAGVSEEWLKDRRSYFEDIEITPVFAKDIEDESGIITDLRF